MPLFIGLPRFEGRCHAMTFNEWLALPGAIVSSLALCGILLRVLYGLFKLLYRKIKEHKV
jgi:hypothetical protein